jgi:putative membrane protein
MPFGDAHSRASSAARTGKRWLLGLFIALWVVSCLYPPYPDELVLQHIPTVLAVILLVTIDAAQPLSLAGYIAVLAFLCLHLLGARYLYTNVPYLEWFGMLRGHGATALAEGQRNHYDRLVHFLYGLLLAGVAREFLQKATAMSCGWAWLMAICVIMATSAMYEILEWCVALLLAPEQAEAYNGQQGDMWDAQKDMTLALAGSLVACIISLAATLKSSVNRAN